MTGTFQDRLAAGARNLLVNCAGCQEGQRLLVVRETTCDGYYDPHLSRAILHVADGMGLHTETCGVPWIKRAGDPDPALAARIEAADCTLFLARLGDQIRFRPVRTATTQIISYALDRDMLASPFGTIDYRAFAALKTLIDTALARADEIHVTCPAGTDFTGTSTALPVRGGDTTCKRFPVSVFAPVPAADFAGRIAQTGFLTGTGSQYYTPWCCPLEETLMVHFDGSRITEFDGTPRDVAAATAHYDFVGDTYGIDRHFVHSWHAGIHPGCAYPEPAGRHMERWSGAAFGNPRLLHFHTCGAYPPGEISLNILDPTLCIDGVAVWQDGVLRPERLAGGAALLQAYPDMRAVFDHPATEVGQASCGRLKYGEPALPIRPPLRAESRP